MVFSQYSPPPHRRAPELSLSTFLFPPGRVLKGLCGLTDNQKIFLAAVISPTWGFLTKTWGTLSPSTDSGPLRLGGIPSLVLGIQGRGKISEVRLEDPEWQHNTGFLTNLALPLTSNGVSGQNLRFLLH